jgi:hypothetical protein
LISQTGPKTKAFALLILPDRHKLLQ